VARAIRRTDPRLARELGTELAGNHSNELSDMLAWVNSKFDRVLRSPAMRAAFGSGCEAIDVQGVMDRGEVLLIDLAAPRIGQDQAAFIGMTWIMEHALAMAVRRRRRPHLLVIDEAQLFRAGGLPELLAEGRKFGVGVLLAHQHMGQLSTELAGSLEANASTVMGMRSSIRDAVRVEARIGTWAGGSLSRLPNMHVATTLATPTGQTQAFTLVVDHNERADALSRERPGAAGRNRRIVECRAARRHLGLGDIGFLGGDDVDAAIRECAAGRADLAGASSRTSDSGHSQARGGGADTSFLDELLAKRKAQQQLRKTDSSFAAGLLPTDA
ncbi:MAG: AAA family ATPase, partial [Actinomyces sp.]